MSTADQLTAALAAAAPGTTIHLADGTYSGEFVASTSGTAQAPIYLCGGRGAVLDGGGTSKGYVLHLNKVASWRVVGMTVQDGQKGIVADGTTNSVIQSVLVKQIGDEAIHLRASSTDNIVRDSTVTDTGLRRAKFGEGIYVGTAKSNWCTISNCVADPSDHDVVYNNHISNTTAESVDIKEGTQDGIIAHNTFDGAKLSGADSWVDVKGNSWLILENTGSKSTHDGFQTHNILDPWGNGNLFVGNSGSGLGPKGSLIALTPVLGNQLSCSNKVTDNSGPVTNSTCVS